MRCALGYRLRTAGCVLLQFVVFLIGLHYGNTTADILEQFLSIEGAERCFRGIDDVVHRLDGAVSVVVAG